MGMFADIFIIINRNALPSSFLVPAPLHVSGWGTRGTPEVLAWAQGRAGEGGCTAEGERLSDSCAQAYSHTKARLGIYTDAITDPIPERHLEAIRLDAKLGEPVNQCVLPPRGAVWCWAGTA